MHGRGVCVVGGACDVWQGHACPPPRYYEIRSMSGQYASYWNAFLLLLCLFDIISVSVLMRLLFQHVTLSRWCAIFLSTEARVQKDFPAKNPTRTNTCLKQRKTEWTILNSTRPHYKILISLGSVLIEVSSQCRFLT